MHLASIFGVPIDTSRCYAGDNEYVLAMDAVLGKVIATKEGWARDAS